MSKTIEEVVETTAAAAESSNTDKNTEEVMVRPYTLRRFKDGDLFSLLHILKKIGLKDCKEAFVQVATEGKSLKQVGMLVGFDMADILLGNLFKVEEEIYTLYADMAGITVEQLKNMEFGTLPLMIVDSFNEVKNTSFFKVLSRLL